MARNRPGLTDEQVADLRTKSSGTRKPRVRLLGTQFGDDVTGQVVAVGDPAADGEEYISVRVKLGSVTDTLSMGPAELAIATRGGAAKSAAPKAIAARKAPSTATPPKAAAPKPIPGDIPAAPKTAAPKTSTPRTAGPRTAGPKTAAPQSAASKAAVSKAAVSKAAVSKTGASKTAPTAPSAARRSGGKRKAAPAVSVTVSSSGSTWKIAATRGGRSLVKATELTPGLVTGIAELIADRALQDAVAEVNDQSLAVAEERARQLREELAAVESLLQAHQRPGS